MNYELQGPSMTTCGTTTPNSSHQVPCTHFQQDALAHKQAANSIDVQVAPSLAQFIFIKQNRKEIDAVGFTVADILTCIRKS